MKNHNPTCPMRRGFLKTMSSALAATSSLAMYSPSFAAGNSNVVEFRGDVRVNDKPIDQDTVINPNDVVETGDGSLTFRTADSALWIRENTKMTFSRGRTINATGFINVLKGSLGSIFVRGNYHNVATPTMIAGIRGTGLYLEAAEERTFFCLCYGVADLKVPNEEISIKTDYHEQYFATAYRTRSGSHLTPAISDNHTDEDMTNLASYVHIRPSWSDFAPEYLDKKRKLRQQRMELAKPDVT